MIILGTSLMAVGAYFFLFEAKIASGGVGGLSILISEIFPKFEITTINAILNVLLFIIGLIVLGPEFGAYTLTGTLIYSALLIIFEKQFGNVGAVVKDPIVSLIAGSGLMGIGLAIVFNANASTGGTDILAKILNKFFSIGMGTSVMLADSFVIIGAVFILGIEKAIYGILALIVTTVAIDKVLTGFNTLIQMTIISSNIDEINKFINKELNRGTTLYLAQGGYTKQEKKILMTIVGRSQYIRIKHFVNKIDENAFVFISSTNEVIGEGFTREAAQ